MCLLYGLSSDNSEFFSWIDFVVENKTKSEVANEDVFLPTCACLFT